RGGGGGFDGPRSEPIRRSPKSNGPQSESQPSQRFKNFSMLRSSAPAARALSTRRRDRVQVSDGLAKKIADSRTYGSSLTRICETNPTVRGRQVGRIKRSSCSTR